MASIDRTAYPRFKSALTATELQALYRPTDEELRLVSKHARGDTGQLTLLTLLKCHQHLGYTPALPHVPSQIRTYLSQQLHLPGGLCSAQPVTATIQPVQVRSPYLSRDAV